MLEEIELQHLIILIIIQSLVCRPIMGILEIEFRTTFNTIIQTLETTLIIITILKGTTILDIYLIIIAII